MDDDDVSDDLRWKLLSLKVCRNRCLAHATSDQALLVECDRSLKPEVGEE